MDHSVQAAFLGGIVRLFEALSESDMHAAVGTNGDLWYLDNGDQYTVYSTCTPDGWTMDQFLAHSLAEGCEESGVDFSPMHRRRET
jgi:hypothetical protein